MPAPQNQASQKDQASIVLQKIRPELNIEKWPLWKPASSKNPPRTREFEREIILGDGSKGTAKLIVGFTDKGDLTTEDQKIWYALIKDWEEKDRPEGFTSLSMRRVARHLNRGWGTNVIDSITDSLRRLRVTPFTWENAYFDKATGETVEILDTFTILSELKIVTRKKDGVIKRELGYFRFNDFIIKNILAKNTKPILFNIVTGFKSEVAQLLYTHIDLILTGIPLYERRTKELLDELGIIGKEYAYPSGRKRILDRAVKEISGKPLSAGGVIASATIEKTKDGKDYKVVFRKGSAGRYAPAAGEDIQAERESDETPVTYSPKQLSAAEQKAHELVMHFYKLFCNTQTHIPTTKERAQASSLIAQYGTAIALYIVNYAYQEAPKTAYQPKTFGGIMHYASHGFSDYETRQKERERQEQAQAAGAARRAREAAEQQARQHATERYERLSEAERLTLTETHKARLLAEPDWAQASQQGSAPLLNLAIRAAIIQDFMQEETGELGEEQGEETVSPSLP